MIVVLQPGQKVQVQFFESDGEITVEFNKKNIKVKANLPDTKGRVGTVYKEEFGKPQKDLGEGPAKDKPKKKKKK